MTDHPDGGVYPTSQSANGILKFEIYISKFEIILRATGPPSHKSIGNLSLPFDFCP